MKCVAIDDEPMALEVIKKFAQRVGDLELETFTNPVVGIEHVKRSLPEDKTTIWCAAIDPGLNEHKYIVPGFGDAGDLCFGDKL